MTKINIYLFATLFALFAVSVHAERAWAELDELAQMTEQKRQAASKLAYEWTTTEPLIEEAYEAMKKGKRDLAVSLLKKAERQFELAIEQAKYADQHWRLLIPEM